VPVLVPDFCVIVAANQYSGSLNNSSDPRIRNSELRIREAIYFLDPAVPGSYLDISVYEIFGSVE